MRKALIASPSALKKHGDTEGLLYMDRLPTAEEAAVIPRYLGIPKRREYTALEALERMRANLAAPSCAAPLRP
jgi:hypothetical protein